MLIESIDKCSETLTTARSLRENKLSIDKYESTINMLLQTIDTLDKLVSAIIAINNSDFESIQFTGEQIKEIKTSIASCGNACVNQELTESHINALSAVISKYKMQVEMVWRAEVADRVSSLESYLNAILSLLDKKSEAQSILSTLQAGKSSAPTDTSIRELSENISKAHQIADSYKLTPGIRLFLDKVRDGNATFADVTNEVSEWITQENMSRKIKIKF